MFTIDGLRMADWFCIYLCINVISCCTLNTLIEDLVIKIDHSIYKYVSVLFCDKSNLIKTFGYTLFPTGSSGS